MGYTYNSVTIQHCRTLEFSVVQRRDPTYTDSMYSEYTIRVRGFLATSQGLFPGVGPQSNASAVTLNAIKSALETPRRSLSYIIGTTTLVSVPFGMDVKLGPDPLPCTVHEVSTGTFMVECGVVARIVDCDNVCFLRDPIMSLRWTQSESFDENWYSHVNTNGRLIVRSDLLQSADNFRPLATPPLLDDYVRTSSKYTLSPDGLELAFNFDDVERDRLPPFPATKATGTYTVETNKGFGFKRVGTVRLHLEGQKGTSRKLLLLKAVAMAYRKLEEDEFLKDAAGKPQVVISARIDENLFDPVVDVTMTALMSNLSNGIIAPRVGIPAGAVLAGINDILNPAGALGFNLGLGAGGDFNAWLRGQFPNTFGAKFDPGFLDRILPAELTEALRRWRALEAARGGAPAALGLPAAGLEKLAISLMPSIGIETYGLKSGLDGIAPPDRKRLAGLLTAAFRDPCACELVVAELRNTGEDPTNFRNPNIMETRELRGGTIDPPGNIIINAAATITIGVMTPFDTPLLRDRTEFPYTNWILEKTIQRFSGNVQMPGTGTGSTGDMSVIVKAAGAMMIQISTWVAERAGSPPELPPFYLNDPNLVEIDGVIVASDVVPTSDGGLPNYLISGYYKHAIIDPSKYQIVPAVAPFLSDVVVEAAQYAAGFVSENVEDAAAAIAMSARAAGLGLNMFQSPGTTGAPNPDRPPPDPTFGNPPVDLGAGNVIGNAGTAAAGIIGSVFNFPERRP